ncbi:MAG TPA: DUF885 domain-containing protein [Candidatus Acidoferrales bacterium]|nr:DUF885 domain-containing protein [Candidatus Acidoferrales bacterium]
MATWRMMVVAATVATFLVPGATVGREDAAAQWNSLVDDYIERILFAFNPSSGTQAGVHQFDAQLEDYSRANIEKQVAALEEFEKRVAAFDARLLSPTDAADREMLLGAVRSSLLTLRVIQPWEKNPDSYSSTASGGIYVLMIRRFAPTNERLRSAVAREKQIPALLAAARQNLKNPAHISTEIALEQLPGIISFFEKDVPAAFADATDASLKSAFAHSNAAAIAALRDYQSWAKSDLLPRSNGDYRIGPETFAKKLSYEEMVDMPLDRLLEIGMADLRKNQAEFEQVAKQLDPNKSAIEVLQEVVAVHPAPDKLMQTFRDTFDGLIAFIHTKHIVTLPGEVRPQLQETPPFQRATTLASMDAPGPFEKVAKEAYFNVTLPAPKDTPEEINDLMKSYNAGTIVPISVHEAFPGHFVQFLFERYTPTTLRKVVEANTNGEGWAHYCEQMMLDEGYAQPGTGAKDQRESLLIHLGQLQEALLRDSRFVAGIRMHTGDMSFEQAVDFFVKEGYQPRTSADLEAKRGTSNPTYLYYTLGKLQIYKLREDVRKEQGSDFSLQKFHDEFLKQGFPPIAIVRRAMLGDSSPSL